MKRVLSMIVAVLMMVGIFAITGCDNAKKAPKDEVLKVGVLYISPVDDGGYSQAHAEGIAKAVATYGDKIKIIKLDSVDDLDVEATNAAIENLVNDGCKLIFTTSYNYMDPTAAAAAKYPDVYFCHCSGYKFSGSGYEGKNMDAYFGQIESARYLAGIVAGMMTETNQLGYVAAFPIPEVIRGINAYTLGARSVNPDVVVKVSWTNTWFDPAVEQASAEALLADGCDIMAQHQDSPSAIEAAEAAGALSIGYDLTYTGAPNSYLTAPLWDWGTYYTYKIGQVLDGNWKVENYWGGMKEGVAKLDILSPLVSEEAKASVEAARAEVTEKGNAFVFAGPIYDQNGELKVSEGGSLSYEDQMGMNWFVDGVIGQIPS